MTPAAPQYGGDSELQADVMRFMAIIAFCLIAILALVRNAEPVPAPPKPEPVPPTATLKAVPVPKAALPKPAVPEPKPAVPEPKPAVKKPAVKIAEPAVKAAPAAPPVSERAAPEAPSPEAPPDSKGLTLRFASDGDFLRLIARGDIGVYAYREGDVLTLNESYQFLETRAPGQVYELLEGSIPALVLDAFSRARADDTGYRWGVVLPERISRQIETYLGRVDSGQLVIDRFGEVHHDAAS
ncbi:MAG: hypothetical protein AB7I04_04960 [Pseudomonadales bacterium]